MHAEIAGNEGLAGLTACHECDLLLSEVAMPTGNATACCPRCGAMLYRTSAHSLERVLALTLAALILFLIANFFPIVGLNIQGHRIDTTLFGAVLQLWDKEMAVVAVLVGVTTLLVPSIELATFFWLCWPVYRGWRPVGFALVFRALRAVQPWGMVEVFMLGVLVSLVKLSHLAEVLPGPGLWAFAALMLVTASLTAAFDARALWQAWENAGP